ncbi:hypothetical protein DPMN_156515 [Dreissena polymorpha]|uniref:B box-type domain-containing protein n=1 Tax=Dreissena polymorpha TaxID=45954 RepID=A0A9D4FPZ7_DREPO|nr:hypothetical protein DPMN_156515 [Dreissena polymorpha]
MVEKGMECEEPLCAQCKQDHAKIKVSKHHKLCDLADVPPQEIQELLKNLIACPNHEKEEVVYLCKDHDMTCCNKCAMADHRKCEEVKVQKFGTNEHVVLLQRQLEKNSVSRLKSIIGDLEKGRSNSSFKCIEDTSVDSLLLEVKNSLRIEDCTCDRDADFGRRAGYDNTSGFLRKRRAKRKCNDEQTERGKVPYWGINGL